MAHLYKRKNSPFWWIWWRDGARVVRESTGLRVGVGADTRKAQELRAEKSLAESQSVARGENWDWVPEFFADRYRKSPKTHSRYRTAWTSLRAFLDTHAIRAPRQLTYNHSLTFVKWRQTPPSPLYRCSRNNALGEIKILGLIVQEAIRRGFALTNPCRSLGIREDPPAEKPAMTNEEIKKIRTALTKEPDWMRVAFEIAIHQGCRLRECAIPLEDFDLKRTSLTFRVVKGDRPFTTALHPNLIPMVKKWREEGRRLTCEMPSMPSKAWWLLFRRLKLKHLCFHCTRVTVITRLARAGVHQSQAMRYVGHASETIHRVYQRLSVEDLSACVAALGKLPSP